jgi:tRNA(Arg) A34 adenosine deaminase TadA
VPFLVAQVPAPKTNTLKVALQRLLPLRDAYLHLRRISKPKQQEHQQQQSGGVPRLWVLLCPAAESSGFEGLSGEVQAVLTATGCSALRWEVPGIPPRMLSERKAYEQLWPVHFASSGASDPGSNSSAAFMAQAQTDGGKTKARVAQWLRRAGSTGAVCVSEDGELCGEGVAAVDSRHPLGHAVMHMLAAVARGQRERKQAASYYCTGLEVFLAHEPCMMCAMALLHSRVKRVCFVRRGHSTGGGGCHGSEGALESEHQLHLHPNVNHRFDVFAVEEMLPGES